MAAPIVSGWSWIPSLYFAQGLPYAVVMTVSVVMYKIVGGGHTWPGAAIDVPLGHTTKQVSASQELVKLFSSV